jgi:hypothetical protein
MKDSYQSIDLSQNQNLLTKDDPHTVSGQDRDAGLFLQKRDYGRLSVLFAPWVKW